MAIRWKITTDKPADVTVRGWRQLLTECWAAVGRWWDEVVKPRLFDSHAAAERGWKPRSERYLKQKLRHAQKDPRIKEGGTRLMVFSGQTRTDVMRPQFGRAFPTRLTILIPTREYVQMRSKAPNKPNLGEELATLTAGEMAEAAHLWQEQFETRLRLYREKTAVS